MTVKVGSYTNPLLSRTGVFFGLVVIKKNAPLGGFTVAEEKGFEPLIPFRAYTLSRRAGSTTPALLHWGSKTKVFRLKRKGN